MKDNYPIPLTTLEQSLAIARLLRRELEREDKNGRLLQVFASLTANYLEALIAFLIWKSRGTNARNACGKG
jgi:hypothetical protein